MAYSIFLENLGMEKKSSLTEAVEGSFVFCVGRHTVADVLPR